MALFTSLQGMRLFIRYSIVTMALSYIISEIKQILVESGVFLSRDAMHSVDYDVCLSRADIMSKRLNVDLSSNFFRHRLATPFYFFIPNATWRYSSGDPITGALNARGYEKIATVDQYLALSRK